MAEIQEHNPDSKSRHKIIRLKRKSTFLDMTPMVDLAFLLLTFFILTTSFRNIRAVDLLMPDNTPVKNPNTISESQAFNLILFKDNKLKWYIGGDDKINSAVDADLTGKGPGSIDDILRQKNSLIIHAVDDINDSAERGLIPADTAYIHNRITIAKKNPNGLVVLIKTTDDAKYQSLVKVLDEINLIDVGRYALMDMTANERTYLRSNGFIPK